MIPTKDSRPRCGRRGSCLPAERYGEPMRLWLKDSERRPDPVPAKTDDRKAILVGLVLWLVALAGLLLFLPAILASGHGWWLWTVLIGLGLGLVLLVFAHRKQV